MLCLAWSLSRPENLKDPPLVSFSSTTLSSSADGKYESRFCPDLAIARENVSSHILQNELLLDSLTWKERMKEIVALLSGFCLLCTLRQKPTFYPEIP